MREIKKNESLQRSRDWDSDLDFLWADHHRPSQFPGKDLGCPGIGINRDIAGIAGAEIRRPVVPAGRNPRWIPFRCPAVHGQTIMGNEANLHRHHRLYYRVLGRMVEMKFLLLHRASRPSQKNPGRIARSGFSHFSLIICQRNNFLCPWP